MAPRKTSNPVAAPETVQPEAASVVKTAKPRARKVPAEPVAEPILAAAPPVEAPPSPKARGRKPKAVAAPEAEPVTAPVAEPVAAPVAEPVAAAPAGPFDSPSALAPTPLA